MQLHGQAESRTRRTEGGYAMAALLVALAVMAILLTAAIPVWRTAAKREKETELVWRAGQYVRAIELFRRKYANAYPPNLDILLNERFLRRKYKDPMTKDGEFQLIYAAQQQQAGMNPPRPPTPLDQRTQGPAGAQGGIVGVMSKSTETSLRVFNGRTKYNEWPLTAETLNIRVPGAGGTAEGVPGGARGVGPDGRPVGQGGAPARGRMTLDPSGRPTTPGGQPGQPPPQRPFGLPPQRPPR